MKNLPQPIRLTSFLAAFTLLFCWTDTLPAQAEIIVTTIVDEEDGAPDPSIGNGTSLREAINYALEDSVITFAPPLTGQTINLSHPDGQLLVETSLSIDASHLPDGLTINGNGSDENRRRVLTISENLTVSLFSLIITGGWTSDGEGSDDGEDGGGIYLSTGSNLTLGECSVSDNRTGDSGDPGFFKLGGRGGGIFTEPNSILFLSSCSILGNQTGNGRENGLFEGFFEDEAGFGGNGGGIFSQSDSLTLTDCIISNNQTGHGGSSVVNGDPSFSFPRAGDGGSGGGLAARFGTVTLGSCLINNNRCGDAGNGASTSDNGGSGGAGGGMATRDCNVLMTDCLVSENESGKGGNGGDTPFGSGDVGAGGDGRGAGAGAGLFLLESQLIMARCTVSKNITGNGGQGGNHHGGDGSDGPGGDGGLGGSAGDGGGIWLQSNGTSTITASTIESNQTGRGGDGGRAQGGGNGANNNGGGGGNGSGIYTLSDRLELTSCTVSGNTTGDGGNGGIGQRGIANGSADGGFGGDGGNGGGISIGGREASLHVRACTITENFSGQGGDGGTGELSPDGFAGVDGRNGNQGDGGGIYDDSRANQRPENSSLQNTILAENTAAPHPDLRASGDISTLGNNLFSDLTDTGLVDATEGVILLTSPLNLSPLGSYGGPTMTMLPLPGSPAINAGDTVDSEGSDQRGQPRFAEARLDIGAVEFQGVADYANVAPFVWEIDPDGDNSPFGVEFALGTDPFAFDPENPNNLDLSFDSSGTPLLAFGVNSNAIGVAEWLLERSTNLQDWDEILFQDSNPQGSQSIVDDYIPRAFYRFRANLIDID